MSELNDLDMAVIGLVEKALQTDSVPTEESIRERVRTASIVANLFPEQMLDTEDVVQELMRRYAVRIGQNSTISDNADHEAWLNAARKRDWRYWARYREMLEKRYSPKAVDALDASTDEILELLEAPGRSGSWDRRGLVVGHIQSGKTSNYTGLVCKAADAGYKIIIVLAGMHNNLRSQTQIRLEEGFLGYETTENPDKPARYFGVGAGGKDYDIRPNCATNRSEDGDFNTRVARHLAISPEGRPWLFVIKKHKGVLERLLKWIHGYVADATDSTSGRKYVSTLPLLLIDDEADHASVDEAKQEFDEEGAPDADYEPRAINSRIRRILHSFSKVGYVGYTATPFANVFIHRDGTTPREGADLFPKSFIINLAAPSNYVGPVRMFGIASNASGAAKDDGEGETPEDNPLPLMHIIEDARDEEGGGWMPVKHDKAHRPRYSSEEELPPSLRQAIQSFILSCAAREVRGQEERHSSMLIHVTRFQNVQSEVCRQVREYVTRLRQRLTRDIDAADLLEQLRTLWEEDFVKVSSAMAEKAPDLGPYHPVAWEQVRERLGDVASDIAVKEINGKASDILDYAAASTRGLRVIAIGGDKLSRGLTLEGLCCSYFIRPSKMYDTLMQMGRWFGFRHGYLDLCRLYSTQDLLDGFRAITQAAEELRDEFELMRSNGDTPEQYGMRVRTHPGYEVTSPMKMRKATSVNVSFSGTLVETAVLHTAPPTFEINLEATIRLLHACGEPQEGAQIARQRGGKPIKRSGWLWRDVRHEHIENFFGDYVSHPDAWQASGHLLRDFVRSMARTGQLTTWTVFLAGGEKVGAPFEFLPGLRIEHMVRRTASNKSDAGRYMLTGRRLSSSGGSSFYNDETIDLSNERWEAALELTRFLRSADPGRSVDGKEPEEPTDPNGPAIRAKRPQENGLLMLYPLDPRLANFTPGFGGWDKPIMAFAASFPASENSVPVSYAIDHLSQQRWSQEYGEVA